MGEEKRTHPGKEMTMTNEERASLILEQYKRIFIETQEHKNLDINLNDVDSSLKEIDAIISAAKLKGDKTTSLEEVRNKISDLMMIIINKRMADRKLKRETYKRMRDVN